MTTETQTTETTPETTNGTPTPPKSAPAAAKSAESAAKAKPEAASGKFELFLPEEIHLVTDEKHYLYDERVNMPVDEELARNIQHKGVIEPVIITKDEKYGITCVAGRQRVKATAFANKLIKKEGGTPIKIRCIFDRGDNLKLFSTLVAENEFRTQDSQLGRAVKMQKMKDLGATDDDLAIGFKMCKASVKNTLSLLECTSRVKKAIEAEQLPVSAAYKMSKLTAAEQNTKLDEILAETGGSTSKKKRSKKIKEATSGGKAGKSMVSKKEASTRRAEWSEIKGITESHRVAVMATLDWVLGKPRAMNVLIK